MSDFHAALAELEGTPAQGPILAAFKALEDKIESLFNVVSSNGGRLDRFEAALHAIWTSSNPKVVCVLCNGENHSATRCTAYPDPITRTVQASKLGLCTKCLKAEHPDDCGQACKACRLPHHHALCPGKRVFAGAKRRKHGNSFHHEMRQSNNSTKFNSPTTARHQRNSHDDRH
ncbi:unnamed protein product [Nippostrongylus brasiliensis]|uniref:DUF1759 domain-containing protein n=1 Tax=Nippostrongylus brasiliensis TaxID=27835 RepID=A0A0N4XSQ8_NIPBR|nr:unnamed protein product [Nippostrongylus brasiliensis]